MTAAAFVAYVPAVESSFAVAGALFPSVGFPAPISAFAVVPVAEADAPAAESAVSAGVLDLHSRHN